MGFESRALISRYKFKIVVTVVLMAIPLEISELFFAPKENYKISEL